MSEPNEELLEIADALDSTVAKSEDAQVQDPLNALADACEDVGKAWSGSWQGYHANVYYAHFETPPPGAHFSQEWGLMDNYGLGRMGTIGEWQEFEPNAVKNVVKELAGEPDLTPARDFIPALSDEFENAKAAMLSLIETENGTRPDPFLEKLKGNIEEIELFSKHDVLEHIRPKGQIMTRDTVVVGQGQRVPPHFDLQSEVSAICQNFNAVRELAKFARQAGSHLSRQKRQRKRSETVGTNVFIGHGQSLLWRELKDFVQDRLKLPVDEFNRVPVAGVTNIARLSEMLDAAAIAFLILTGEDEQPDGKMHARMNVIHEAGLFQGRLSFTRAIVVLEEGCEEFSNIEGLGQIRFPKGNIKAAFEEIRQVLEREGLIEGG